MSKCHAVLSECFNNIETHVVTDDGLPLTSEDFSGFIGDIGACHRLELCETVHTISVKSVDVSQVNCTHLPESNSCVDDKHCGVGAFVECDLLHTPFNVTKNVEETTDDKVNALFKDDWVSVSAAENEIPLVIPVVKTCHEVPSVAFDNKVDIVGTLLAAGNEVPELVVDDAVHLPVTGNRVLEVIADEINVVGAMPAGVDEALEIIENEEPIAAHQQPALVQPLAFLVGPPAQGLGDQHQAMMQAAGPMGFQPYKRPDLFALKVSCGDAVVKKNVSLYFILHTL